MVFLIFIIIFISIIFSKIKLEVKEFKFTFENNKIISNNFEGSITIYLLKCIPIFKSKINNKKLQKFKLKDRVKKLSASKKIDKNILKIIKKSKPNVKKINLHIMFDTENSALTAYIYAIIKIIITNLIKKDISIQPLFNNNNFINIDFNGIFEINLQQSLRNMKI